MKSLFIICNIPLQRGRTKMPPRKPKILVFDLDYTLWPFWVDTHVTPPFQLKDGEIRDAHHCKVKCYPEVPNVLKTLHEQGYELAVASRTSELKGANELIKLFGWDKYFTYKQIYPGCKINHFNLIKSESKMHFEEMIFFDDEHRNIRDVTRLGVLSILVKNGVSQKLVEDALKEYEQKYV